MLSKLKQSPDFYVEMKWQARKINLDLYVK